MVQGQFIAPPIIHHPRHDLLRVDGAVRRSDAAGGQGRDAGSPVLGDAGRRVGDGDGVCRVRDGDLADRLCSSAAGYREEALRFSWIQVGGITLFAALFILAIVNVKKAEVHKRLMLVATISLLQAPIARWFAVLLAPPAPPAACRFRRRCR